MTVEEVIRTNLPKVNVMQLATCVNNQPWICNLHFYSENDLAIYWLSTVDRRHSKEIAKNPKVALTIKVHENTSNEDYVIGISLEGTAGLLDENEYESVAKSYQSKHGTSDAFINSVLSGENPHKFYKFVPQNAVLFDNKNFPKDPRQEWTLV